jgi:hypothetical protein
LSPEFVPNWITLIQHMAEWVYSNDIPNWSTLIVEIVIGVGIALYLFYLQSKTSTSNKAVISKINEATQKIDSYIEGKKKIEEATKRFHVDRIIKNLEYIKQQDEQARNIITEFKKTGNFSEMVTPLDIVMGMTSLYIDIETMCHENMESLRRLEGSFNNPGAGEKIMDYQSVLSAPFKALMKPEAWRGINTLSTQEATSLIEVHLNEINEYLDLLSRE